MKRIATSLLVVLLLAGSARACPMCKDSVPNTDVSDAAAVPAGFNASIYTMLGGMLGMLGVIGGVIYKGVKDTPH